MVLIICRAEEAKRKKVLQTFSSIFHFLLKRISPFYVNGLILWHFLLASHPFRPHPRNLLNKWTVIKPDIIIYFLSSWTASAEIESERERKETNGKEKKYEFYLQGVYQRGAIWKIINFFFSFKLGSELRLKKFVWQEKKKEWEKTFSSSLWHVSSFFAISRRRDERNLCGGIRMSERERKKKFAGTHLKEWKFSIYEMCLNIVYVPFLLRCYLRSCFQT